MTDIMRLVTYILLGFIFISCADDNEEASIDLGYDYFPVEIGTYVEYRADSIWHDQPSPTIPGIHDTTSYFIKEVIDSEIVDAQEEPSLRILRYKKMNEEEEWSLVDVWFSKRSAQNAEKVEENVRYIKLAFPIRESSTWDLNALNVKDEWQSRYDSLYYERTYDELVLPRTVMVLQRENKNLIEDEFAYEIYAENIGLVKRYERVLTTQLNYVDEPIAENIRSGHEFKWEIVDYGVE